MSWNDISISDGLDYKEYSPNKENNWFKNTKFSDKKIYKFRVTQKYRCFGYRELDTFYVLMFDIEHKISDKG